MKLAAEGLPSSVPQGYDILEKIPMGTSRSVEAVKIKQTLGVSSDTSFFFV